LSEHEVFSTTLQPTVTFWNYCKKRLYMPCRHAMPYGTSWTWHEARRDSFKKTVSSWIPRSFFSYEKFRGWEIPRNSLTHKSMEVLSSWPNANDDWLIAWWLIACLCLCLFRSTSTISRSGTYYFFFTHTHTHTNICLLDDWLIDWVIVCVCINFALTLFFALDSYTIFFHWWSWGIFGGENRDRYY